VVISEVILEGPVSLSSIELSTIKSQLAGACFDEQEDVIGQFVRNAFAEQGFAASDVENVSLKASDALAVPKPVTLKAEVSEGPRYRIGEIKFVGNHAFSAAKLRAAFPIKRGAIFRKSKIASGLAEIRKLYSPRGYGDLVFVPDIMFSATGTVALTVSISEGPQYRMGELKVYAKKEIADRLASEWRLREGALFDMTYPQAFADSSHSLPSEVSRPDVLLVRNCPEASIAVLLIVDQTDPGLQNRPKDIRCEKAEAPSELFFFSEFFQVLEITLV
jgi:outer membrane protein insertion porin family